MPGNPSPSNGASEALRNTSSTANKENTIRAQSTAAAVRTTHDQPQRAAKKSDRALDTRGRGRGGRRVSRSNKEKQGTGQRQISTRQSKPQRKQRKCTSPSCLSKLRSYFPGSFWSSFASDSIVFKRHSVHPNHTRKHATGQPRQ